MVNSIKGCAVKRPVSRYILFADASTDKTAENFALVFTSRGRYDILT